MEAQSKCICCFRDLDLHGKNASNKKNKRTSSSFTVFSDEFRDFIIKNSKETCKKRKTTFISGVIVTHDSLVCYYCRSDFDNSKKKKKKPANSTELVDLDDPQPGPSRDLVREENIIPQPNSDSFTFDVMAESLSDYLCNSRSSLSLPPAKRFHPNPIDQSSSSSEENQQLSPRSFRRGLGISSSSEDESSDDHVETSPQLSQPNESGSEYQPPVQVDININNRSAMPRIMATTCSHSTCIFSCRTVTRLKSIPLEIKMRVLCAYKLFIPDGAKCCESHMSSHVGWERLTAHRDVTNEELYLIADKLISHPSASFTLQIPDAVEENNSTYEHYTSLSVSQFIDLRSHIKNKASEITKTRRLFCFLMKIYHDLTDSFIAKLVGIHETTFGRWKREVLAELKANFVPLNLGIRPQIDRQNVQEHITPISRSLLLETTNRPDRVITIWDGTYIYSQSSMNMDAQHRLYSAQKKNHLCKPMVAIFPDGYILDVFTIYAASSNDASIMKHLFETNENIKSYFGSEDVFVLDRGFRDVRDYLEGKGYQVYIPRSLPQGSNQSGWRQANENRIVTKNRWTVEAVNAQLKRFSYLKYMQSNVSLLSIEDVLKLCAALVNKYKPRLVSDRTTSSEIIHRMLSRLNKPNLLYSCITEKNVNRLTRIFRNYDAVNESRFPRVDENDIYYYACGSYVVKYLRSYKAHTINQGDLFAQLCTDNTSLDFNTFGINALDGDLYRVKIRSRYSVSKMHIVYILVDLTKENLDRFAEHHCDCKSGQRTISCCNHVGVAIWLLGGWLSVDTRAPASHLNQFALRLTQPREQNDNESTDDALSD